MATNELNETLLHLTRSGVRLIPVHTLIDGACSCDRPDCPDPAKHPLTPSGVNDATGDGRVLRGWHRETGGRCNWAVATGPASGVWVLDIDPRHGGDDALAALVGRHGPLPRTPTVGTGGGGTHYYFRWPSATHVPSKANVAPGIDVRGAGGYAVCPPSVHASGRRYEWQVPPDEPPAEAPPWLLALVTAKPATSDTAAGAGAARIPLSQQPDVLPASDSGRLIVQAGTADLTNSPGVGEGGRHARLCQLVGVHVARGEGEDRVEALALAWAETCHPPMPEAEVVKAVQGIVGKHRRGVPHHHHVGHHDEPDADLVEVVPTGPSERTKLVPTTPATGPGEIVRSLADDWPVLHPDALHGLAGAITRAVAPETEADEVGVLLSLMAGLGNLVGRGPAVSVGPDRQQANLFVALVGDTASGKGQSFGVAKHLLRHADPDWMERCISYGLSTGEGLIGRVQDPDPDEDAGPPPPVPDKRLLALETEFGRTFTAMRREGNTLSAVLRAAWDGQPLEVLTRKGKLRAADAHVGVLAHITPEELRKLLSKGTEVCDGFANRFLWCLVRSEKCLPHGGDIRVLTPFLDPLAAAAAWARAATAPVRRTAEADRLWEAVYPALKASRPGPWGKATERARPQALRLALLYALLDRSGVITEAHLRAGLAVWGYCCESARLVFGDGTATGPNTTIPMTAQQEEPLAVRVLSLIQAKPGAGRRGLYEGCGNRVKADALDEALAWLTAHGLAHPRTTSTGGRPAECWWPGPGEPVEGRGVIPAPEQDADPMLAADEDAGGARHDLAAASEQTLPGTAVAVAPEPEIVRSLAAPEPTDAPVMTNDKFLDGLATGPLSLADLIARVNTLGGKFVNTKGVVVVDAPGSLPEAVLTAVTTHQPQLQAIVPPPAPSRPEWTPDPEWKARYDKAQIEYQAELRRRRGDDDPPITEEEFLTALRSMKP